MTLTIQIPDDLAARLNGAGGDLSRQALEGLAIDAYKADRLSPDEMRELLGIESLDELDGFLKAHDVWIEYTTDDFNREMQDLKRLGF